MFANFNLACKSIKYQNIIARLNSADSSTSDYRSRSGKFESHLGHINFVETDHENNFFSHSLPYADSRKAAVSLWRKYVRKH